MKVIVHFNGGRYEGQNITDPNKIHEITKILTEDMQNISSFTLSLVDGSALIMGKTAVQSSAFVLEFPTEGWTTT